ncbi:hypothetical protein HK101_000588 [Irineochytrium annulatum]|nr:hypothetical protein HK101_000588 [Irineochytrium annulatum]
MTIPSFTKTDVFCTVDPAVVEHILKTNFENFVKGDHFNYILRDLLGVGIFNSDGDVWRVQRKISSNIFTGKRFREVVQRVVMEDLGNLVMRLNEAAEAGRVIDLHKYLHAFTLDTFGKIGFGADLHCLDAPDTAPDFAVAFDAVTSISLVRFPNMLWEWTEPLDGTRAAMKKYLGTIDSFALERIRARREEKRIAKKGLGDYVAPKSVDGAEATENGKAEGKAEEKEVKDLLDLFMQVEESQLGGAAAGEDGAGHLTDRQLRDVLLNMILAGRDTTAQALSWCILELSRQPAIVEKIRTESSEVTDGKVPTFDGIKSLKYTNAVFLEALRLYPSVPANVKHSIKEDVLPGGIVLPANTEVNWFPYAMGRQTSLWGDDATIFRPERWIDEAGNVKRVSPFLFTAFNAGPRVCLGQQMAMVEAVMTLVALCNKFDFEATEHKEKNPRPALALTLMMAGGLPMRVVKRA